MSLGPEAVGEKHSPPRALTIDGQLHLPFGVASGIGGGADVLATLLASGGHHVQTPIRPCGKFSTAGGDQLAFLQNMTKSKFVVVVVILTIKRDLISGRGRKNLQEENMRFKKNMLI